MASKPTQRTIAALKAAGFECGIVEKWNQFARVRQDLFGFIDIVAMKSGVGIIGIQTTSATNMSARITKIKAEPRSATWLRSGGRIVVHGWGKFGLRGKRKTWQCRAIEINLQGTIPARPL